MAVSRALRFEILRRDQFRCHYCGVTPEQSELHVDHVVPQALGGTNDPSNLVTACAECNGGKAGRTLAEPVVAEVDEKAQRYALAVEQAIEERRQVLASEKQVQDDFRAIWDTWQPAQPLPAGFGRTVHQIMRAGLEWEDVIDSIEIAMSKQKLFGEDYPRFKYFRGVCNRKIEAIRKRADDIMVQQKPAMMITEDQYYFAQRVAEYWERYAEETDLLLDDRKLQSLALLHESGLDAHEARILIRYVHDSDTGSRHKWEAFILAACLFLKVHFCRPVEEVLEIAQD